MVVDEMNNEHILDGDVSEDKFRYPRPKQKTLISWSKPRQVFSRWSSGHVRA